MDHINHNTLDNRRSNLRVCSHTENMWNRRASRNKKHKGVDYRADARCAGKNWVARITRNHKRVFLGYFRTEQEAATAYNNAAKLMHGNFAHLNQTEAA